MGELSKLPNIGKEIEHQLEETGIHSPEQLRQLGAEKAWLKIRQIDESACMHRLLALEGAVWGVKKTLLPQNRKDELKKFYESHKKMKLKKIAGQFSICKVDNSAEVDFSKEFWFMGKTDEEISLVCLTKDVPQTTLERADGWNAFRVEAVLDFSLIGILARISAVLAEEKIGIFVVSTYNTDYVLVKSENYEKAMKALKKAGYEIV